MPSVKRTQFERSRSAPIKALGTCEREVTRHVVRWRPSSARPTGLRMALVARVPASLRGLNALSPRGAYWLGPRRISRNAQWSFDRGWFRTRRASRNPAQRSGLSATTSRAHRGRPSAARLMKSQRTAFAFCARSRDPLRVIAPKAQVDATSRCCPTASRGITRCFALFRRCASPQSITHFLLQRIFCSLRMYCRRRQRPSAPSSRHALSANGGLRVRQDIRKHVVEASVQALVMPRDPVSQTLATARPQPARFTPTRPPR